MKLSVASLVVLLSVGGVAASQDLLLRGSKTSDRQLKKPDAKCKDSDYASCNNTGGSGSGLCEQCCECECDVEKATEKCSEIGCDEDEVSNVTGDCATTCAGACGPSPST